MKKILLFSLIFMGSISFAEAQRMAIMQLKVQNQPTTTMQQNAGNPPVVSAKAVKNHTTNQFVFKKWTIKVPLDSNKLRGIIYGFSTAAKTTDSINIYGEKICFLRIIGSTDTINICETKISPYTLLNILKKQISGIIDEMREYNKKAIDYDEKINNAKDSIVHLKDSIATEKDAIYAINTHNRLYLSNSPFSWWFLSHPSNDKLRNTIDIDTLNKFIYNNNKIAALQNLYTRIGSQTFVGTEFFNTFIGPFRASISGLVQSTGDTSKDTKNLQSIQSLVTNNGTLSLNFSTPLWLCTTKKNIASFMGFFSNYSGLYSGSNLLNAINIAYSNSTELDLVGTLNSKLGLSFQLPIKYTWGSSNLYAQTPMRDYCLIEGKCGLVIVNKLTLLISGPFYSSSKVVQRTPFMATIQISPAQLVNSK